MNESSLSLLAGDNDNNCFSQDASSIVCVPVHVSCTDASITTDNTFVNSGCFSFHGQSGSPVWLYYKGGNADGDNYLIRGVLASGPNDGGDATFTLINEAVFTSLEAWMKGKG